MNTLSLVLNGQTASSLALLPEKQRSSITAVRPTLSRAMSSFAISTSAGSRPTSPNSSPTLTYASGPSTPTLSGRSTPFSLSRPGSSRRTSKDSPGWYNPNENNMTLDDFARKLNTRYKRFEIWQGKCAQSIVMALLRPTPLVLFVFNPICLLIWAVLAVWYFSGAKEP